ncbi:MAG: hypothetical protein IPK73_22030 [Candidatus Obscuribacter sp.]|nr:hypothetical protein [Candidatus Obscuribacter sp.]MBK9276793.1 hypothetical protein [Candidatus Obscuribacter sp.]
MAKQEIEADKVLPPVEVADAKTKQWSDTSAEIWAKPQDGKTDKIVTGAATEGIGPHPDTWKMDDKGNVLQAGDKYKATYDAQGQLTEANFGDSSYKLDRKTGTLTETFIGNDGQQHSYKTENVKDFSAKPFEGNTPGGPFKGMGIEAKTEGGSGTSRSSVIWETDGTSTWRDFMWDPKNVVEATGPDQPHPKTWKYDDQGRLTKAGTAAEMTYGASGDLTSVKLGTDTYERSGPDEIKHTRLNKEGKEVVDVIKGVTDFAANPYFSSRYGRVAGVSLDIKYGATSREGRSVPLWKSEELEMNAAKLFKVEKN